MSPTKMVISKGKTWKILIYKHHFLTGHTVRFRMINDDKCHVRFWRRKHQLRKLWANGRNDRWCWKAFLACLKQTYSDISSRIDTSKICVGVVLSMKCWVHPELIHPRSAGSQQNKLSAFNARAALIRAHGYPKTQIDQDLQALVKLFPESRGVPVTSSTRWKVSLDRPCSGVKFCP